MVWVDGFGVGEQGGTWRVDLRPLVAGSWNNRVYLPELRGTTEPEDDAAWWPTLERSRSNA
jgi:hypothetical protein